MQTNRSAFNREKAAFLAVAVLCAILVYDFIRARPTPLVPGAPRVSTASQPVRSPASPIMQEEESAYFDGTRKSPFVVPKAPPPPTEDKGGVIIIAEGPIEQPGIGRDKDDAPVDPMNYYTFAGVVVHAGSSHALLQRRDSAQTVRAEAGHALDGGYTVTRVNKQSIELRHSSGRTYLLRDRE